MNKFCFWLKALWYWLSEYWHFAFAIVVTVIALFISLRPGTTESVIRLTGLVLQILGIGTVAWGIRETRALFGRPPLFNVFKSWLSRFPRFQPKATSGSVDGASGLFTVNNARGYSMDNAGPDATPEDRIEVLEKNIKRINERIDQARQEIDAEFRNIDSALKREERVRATENEEIRHKLEVSETGGIHITAIGAIWLLVGGVLSNASPELSKWLQ